MKPSYLSLLKSGELEKRVSEAVKRLSRCDICPHRCNVDRLNDQRGFCKIGRQAVVASYGAHFGEEPPITGTKGSGTTFFSGCNMKCLYCQNYEISHGLEGYEVTKEYLAFIFLSLQEGGCHNINLVTPTHVVPQILEALLIAAKEGLKIPIVYNCGGYESVETLRLLEGIVDIYMPDIKYSDSEIAQKLSKIKNYWEVAKQALKEMHRQVGDLILEERSKVALKGLLIRHLVLPEDLSGSKKIFEFIATEISKNSVINIMDQYRPCGKAFNMPPLDRMITRDEFNQAIKWAREQGLKRLLTF